MTALPALEIIVAGVRLGWRDFRVQWSVRTWLFGWLLRVIAQCLFFASIGGLLASAARTQFLVEGAVAVVGVTATMLTLQAVSWERLEGTLALLIIAPGAPRLLVAGRTIVWLLDGWVTSVLALTIMAPAFGLGVTLASGLAAALALLALNLSTYSFASFLGVLTLYHPATRNLASFVATLGLTAFSGATVPLGFWPAPVQWVAATLPVSHGLDAFRDCVIGAPASSYVGSLALEVGVASAWAALFWAAWGRLEKTARRSASIDLSAS